MSNLNRDTIFLTPPKIFEALLKVFIANGNQPVSIRNLITYLRQNGYGDSWDGALEDRVEAGLRILTNEGRVISVRSDYYIPAGKMQQRPQGPVAPIGTAPLNFHRMPNQKEPPPTPPALNRLIVGDPPSPFRPRTLKLGRSVAKQTEPPNVYRPFLQRTSIGSTSSPWDTPAVNEDEYDTSGTETGTSQWPTNDGVLSSYPSSGSEATTMLTAAPTSRSTATSSGSDTRTTTTSSQVPNQFRPTTVTPSDFNRYLKNANPDDEKDDEDKDEEM